MQKRKTIHFNNPQQLRQLMILIIFLAVGIYWIYFRKALLASVPIPSKNGSQSAPHKYPEGTPPIEAIGDDFNWETAKPFKLRPFIGKKNFNPSMSLRNISNNREDLLLIERSYLTATTLRIQHLEEYPDKLVFCSPEKRSVDALREFYSMCIDFLGQRYPQYFLLQGSETFNVITGKVIPNDPKTVDTQEILRLLAANLEEDILIMLKDNPEDPDEEYILKATVNGSPAGFDPSHNFDKPVSEIHKPVPQYGTRLKSPMHRFFNKVQPKDLWMRGNWSIQTNNVLFKLEDHHGREGEKFRILSKEEIDFENACFLRCERQVFTRLPRSHAVIMLVRTYLTPIKEIKDEGSGPDLIRGIQLLPPDLAFYKRSEAWGSSSDLIFTRMMNFQFNIVFF